MKCTNEGNDANFGMFAVHSLFKSASYVTVSVWQALLENLASWYHISPADEADMFIGTYLFVRGGTKREHRSMSRGH